jgi:hypothetical protein
MSQTFSNFSILLRAEDIQGRGGVQIKLTSLERHTGLLHKHLGILGVERTYS